MLALQSLDLRDGHLRGQERVFAESLGRPAPVGHAQDVNGRGQGHVVPLADVLGAQRRPVLLHQAGVEGRRVGSATGNAVTPCAVANPVRAIGEIEVGNADRGIPGVPRVPGPAEPLAVNQRIFSSSVIWLTRPCAWRWAPPRRSRRWPVPPLPGRPRPGACPARAAMPGAAATRARQAAAVTVMTAEWPCRPPASSWHIGSSPWAGTGVTTGVTRAWGRRGWGPVIGRARLQGAAPLSGDARINGR